MYALTSGLQTGPRDEPAHATPRTGAEEQEPQTHVSGAKVRAKR